MDDDESIFGTYTKVVSSSVDEELKRPFRPSSVAGTIIPFLDDESSDFPL